MTIQSEAEKFLEKRKSVIFRARTMKTGEVVQFDDFIFFRRGDQVGAALSTGERLINIHNVHPGRSYSLDGDSALPLVSGNFLTLTVDVSNVDLSDPVKAEDFADRILGFVRTENGNREALLSDPWAWAEKVIEMSGDKISEVKPYPMIAELYLVNALRAAGLLTDVKHEYRGPDAGIHDFELPTMSLECKAHLHGDPEAKKGELVISNEHQLSRTGTKPLYVVYFPMEDAGDLTLEKCVSVFGEPRQDILDKLKLGNFVEGDFSWQRPYHILGQPLVFEITGDFPRITPAQFPGGKFPTGITKLVYHVSLHNRPSCSLDTFIEVMKKGERPVFAV